MFPLTATTGANRSKYLRTLNSMKSPACTMSMAWWKTSNTLGGITLALDGMCVSEIKPTIFKFPTLQPFSFDLSLSPSVVGALAPTIGRSLQGTGFALGAAEGAGSPNTSCQPLNSSTVTSESAK